jgi:ATP-binding cassette subfamily F protein uup
LGGAPGGADRTEKVSAKPVAAEAPRPKATKLSYKDQRDFDLLPRRIEEIEAQIAKDEAALADPDLYARDPGKFATLSDGIGKLREEKEAAEMRWLELAEQVEALG